MDETQSLTIQLRSSVQRYREAIGGVPAEARDDFLRVAGHADAVASALEINSLEGAKSAIYAFSREVADSYHVQPPEYRGLAEIMGAVRKQVMASSFIFGRAAGEA